MTPALFRQGDDVLQQAVVAVDAGDLGLQTQDLVGAEDLGASAWARLCRRSRSTSLRRSG